MVYVNFKIKRSFAIELNFKPNKFGCTKNSYDLKMNRCRISTPPDFNLPSKCIFLSLNIGTSLVAALGNALVIVALYNSRTLRTRSNSSLFYLSTLDMTVGLIVQPLICIVVMDDQLCILVLIVAFFGAFLCGASFNLLAIISYDGYLHLSKLKNYNRYMTSRKSKALVSVVFPALVGCLILHEDMARVFPYIVELSSLVPMSTRAFCYYKLRKIVKNNRKTISTRNRRIDKQWRVVKATGYYSV